VKCHGGEQFHGEVNLKSITTAKKLLEQPDLIEAVIEVVSASNMPPEDEPQLNEQVRGKLIADLKSMLRDATSHDTNNESQIRRLNRIQYNNTIKDLFALKHDVFPLPEKLMTRHGEYLLGESMPNRVRVTSHALDPQPGLQDVKAFPKDLRAAHGFDNQANQLTLSPLLLDAFLRLSVSIVESPDFNEQNVGIWTDFFGEPEADANVREEVTDRLRRFLRLAFRGPVDSSTLKRYTDYTMSKIDAGLTFADSMKKVASAALSSPMFLYRSTSMDESDRAYEIASRLSFFLWSSCPDTELLDLAESGELLDREQFASTIHRMLADPKIERFLDTFPAQWMQLENVLAATPDPQKNRFFSLDQGNPASLQMLLEPLLLFDAVFVEDRPLIDLIAPDFGYQSDFLQTWYSSDLRAPSIDLERVNKENRINRERREALEELISTNKEKRETLIKPVRSRLLADRKTSEDALEPVDLRPFAAWEFNGDLKDSVNELDLTAHGNIQYHDGMVILDRSYLISKKLPIELKAKSLEVWCKLQNIDQRGGGVMGIQGPGDFFDTIVIGERKPRHWISGSNGFSRTEDFPESIEEQMPNQMLHLTMVYKEDGTTTLYRNGTQYGKPYRKGAATFPKENSSVLFGLRHLPPGGNKYLSVTIDKARLYDRALTAGEVAASASGSHFYITDEELLKALDLEQKASYESLTNMIDESEAALNDVPPNQDPGKLAREAEKEYEKKIRQQMRSQSFQRIAASDPRYGGVITNAAILSMTSGPKRTHPIARGAWIIEVIFNDPPPPPPNDVPPLNEEQTADNLTIREKFAKHRENPDCAGCHSRLDPLGFALENFDITGRWRSTYENGRQVDASGEMMRRHAFEDIVEFKAALVHEKRRFATAFTAHLLRFALARELVPRDSLTVDAIVEKTAAEGFKLKSLIHEITLSESFQR
jgi:hypothetical protein